MARMRRYTAALALVLAFATAGGAAAQEPPGSLEVSLFTRIGSPGQPEGIVVDTDGTVYVGTHNAGQGDVDAPSKVFAFEPSCSAST